MPRQKAFELEEMVLLLSVYSAFGVSLWIWLHLPLPDCPFYAFTGYPCLTCGITRAVQSFFEGDFHSAFLLNPLFSVSLAALALFNIYALWVMCAGKMRVRVTVTSAKEAAIIRAAAVGLIIFNWLYLVAVGNGHEPLLSALLLP